MKKNRLKNLIEITHKRGVAISHKIRKLLTEEKGLEKLNAQRRKELKEKEQKPHYIHYITMYDSTDIRQIPKDAQAVAGYVGGRWPTFKDLNYNNFPHAGAFLSIAISSSEDADCLDIEKGDASPSVAPGWVCKQINRGVRRPCLYANLSTMPEVKKALEEAGIKRRVVRLWVAHYTNIAHIPEGYDACQYASSQYLDTSLCLSNFFS